MQVTRHDAEGFLRSAGDFLAAREAEHNLILGLAGRVLRNPNVYGDQAPYLAVVGDQGRVVVAALCTPPFPLVLSECEDTACYTALAADALDALGGLSGVSGPAASVGEFVSAWGSLTGDRARVSVAMRVYEAREVVEPRPVAGGLRDAGPQDRELVLDWLEAFVAEASPDDNLEDAGEWIDRNAADPDGRLVLWDDGATVSLAACGGATPHGIRIGPVYTPPELRGRGYASAVTAELTRQLLAGDHDFCFLFTDLANPTANSIYQRIGYRPVTDFERWKFDIDPDRE